MPRLDVGKERYAPSIVEKGIDQFGRLWNRLAEKEIPAAADFVVGMDMPCLLMHYAAELFAADTPAVVA